jgi:putative ABC transport system permease protein
MGPTTTSELRAAPGFGALSLIVRRSLRQHAVSTSITAASLALASGLVMAIFSIQRQSYDAFTGGSTGFDAVLGARGSQLQLVLNAVFQLETSPGNIPWEMYTTLRDDPRVAVAIPYAVGDNYKGFRIVGTTIDLFDQFAYASGKKLEFQAGGHVFDPSAHEAVIGSYVAQRTGLTVGSTFHPFHGLVYDAKNRHAEEFTVSGIIRATNTPCDRVVWIPIDGIYRMSGHVLRGSGTEYVARDDVAIPDANKEVSAVMLKLKTPQAGLALDQMINKQGKVATLAWPVARVMAELFDKIGWVNRVLLLVAYLVVAVGAGSILASLYNTMNERRREFAILRALGARRATVFAAIVGEASAIAAMGALCGFVVYAAILGAAAAVVRSETGVVLDVMQWNGALLWTPLGVIVAGGLSGVAPAIKAYRTDVAENLVPAS